jgi:hypothetical protein
VLRDPGSRVWPTALALTATLVIGGVIGYVIGRPSQSPALSGELPEGQIRVPDVTGLSLGDARRVLRPMGLDTGSVNRAPSSDQPRGIVLTQQPAPGTGVRTPHEVKATISSGPGPAAGPTYVFARSVLIPIRRSGPFSWTSGPVALDGPPVSLGANTRAIGAETTPYRISSAPVRTGTAISVKFDVKSFRKPAWFVILKAFGRQRESTIRGPRLTITPRSGSDHTKIVVEGHNCQPVPRRASVRLLVFRSADASPRKPVGVGPLISSYAFRLSTRVLEWEEPPVASPFRPGDEVRFVTAGGACRSPPFRVT